MLNIVKTQLVFFYIIIIVSNSGSWSLVALVGSQACRDLFVASSSASVDEDWRISSKDHDVLWYISRTLWFRRKVQTTSRLMQLLRRQCLEWDFRVGWSECLEPNNVKISEVGPRHLNTDLKTYTWRLWTRVYPGVIRKWLRFELMMMVDKFNNNGTLEQASTSTGDKNSHCTAVSKNTNEAQDLKWLFNSQKNDTDLR